MQSDKTNGLNPVTIVVIIVLSFLVSAGVTLLLVDRFNDPARIIKATDFERGELTDGRIIVAPVDGLTLGVNLKNADAPSVDGHPAPENIMAFSYSGDEGISALVFSAQDDDDSADNFRKCVNEWETAELRGETKRRTEPQRITSNGRDGWYCQTLYLNDENQGYLVWRVALIVDSDRSKAVAINAYDITLGDDWYIQKILDSVRFD